MQEEENPRAETQIRLGEKPFSFIGERGDRRPQVLKYSNHSAYTRW
jgi:hypothetical protein